MASLDPSKLPDVDDDLFWREVRAAYDAVIAKTPQELVIDVAVGNKSAEVTLDKQNAVHIFITSYEPKPPTLIAPVGLSDKDTVDNA
jgi:hypothetical protein